MDLLNNAWVIGIGAGIISGLFVFLITRYFFSKKDNKEYFQKISAANREVLYAVRPGISEGEVPNSTILEHLIAATARKYGIEQNAMLTESEIASELIKEVMDSAFISANRKIEFCNKLSLLSESDKKESIYSHMKMEYNASRKYQSLLSSITATTVMVSTVAVVEYLFRNESSNTIIESLMPTMAPAILTVVIVIAYSSLFGLRMSKKHSDTTENATK